MRTRSIGMTQVPEDIVHAFKSVCINRKMSVKDAFMDAIFDFMNERPQDAELSEYRQTAIKETIASFKKAYPEKPE